MPAVRWPRPNGSDSDFDTEDVSCKQTFNSSVADAHGDLKGLPSTTEVFVVEQSPPRVSSSSERQVERIAFPVSLMRFPEKT